MSFFFLRMESHIEAIYTLEMLIRFTTELHYTVKHFVYNFEPKQILFQKQMVGNSIVTKSQLLKIGFYSCNKYFKISGKMLWVCFIFVLLTVPLDCQLPHRRLYSRILLEGFDRRRVHLILLCL